MFAHRFVAFALLGAGVWSAHASLITSADILGPEDGVPNLPPAGVLCVDVLVDMSIDDTWTAGGLRAIAQNGATLRYATDPNTGLVILTNPGTANRFVTFFNKPRDRDANSRFRNGQAAAAGRYSPTGQFPTTTTTEINVAYFASPPETAGSPSVDGAVFRVSVDLPAGHTAGDYFLVAGIFPPANVPLDAILYSTGAPGTSDLGSYNVGFDVAPGNGINWYVAPIPEPSSLLLIVLAGAAFALRH